MFTTKLAESITISGSLGREEYSESWLKQKNNFGRGDVLAQPAGEGGLRSSPQEESTDDKSTLGPL